MAEVVSEIWDNLFSASLLVYFALCSVRPSGTLLGPTPAYSWMLRYRR
jgi:hypothetical protein